MVNPNNKLILERIKELWEKADFYSVLSDSLSGYAIIAVDFDSNILAYNKGAQLIYGYTQEEVIGREKIEILLIKDLAKKEFAETFFALTKEGKRIYESERVRKNGEHFPAQIISSLVRDTLGNLVGFIEITQDLTSLKIG